MKFLKALLVAATLTVSASAISQETPEPPMSVDDFIHLLSNNAACYDAGYFKIYDFQYLIMLSGYVQIKLYQIEPGSQQETEYVNTVIKLARDTYPSLIKESQGANCKVGVKKIEELYRYAHELPNR